MSTVTLKLPHSKLSLFNIYRPPSSSAKSRDISSFSQFLEDFQTLISSISTSPHDFLITGDFNIHVDDLNDSSALQFISLLDLANLTQHVSFPTHRLNHTLDLVITPNDSTLCSVVSHWLVSPSDHFPILYTLNISRPPSPPVFKHLTRAIHSINIERFARDIMSSISSLMLLLIYLIPLIAITLHLRVFWTTMHLSHLKFYALSHLNLGLLPL